MATRSVDGIRAGVDAQLEHAPLISFGSRKHRLLFLRALRTFADQLRGLGLLSKTVLLAPAWATHTRAGTPTPSSFGLRPDRANRLYDDYHAAVRHTLDPTVISLTVAEVAADPDHPWGIAPFHYTEEVYENLTGAIASHAEPRISASPRRVEPGGDAQEDSQATNPTNVEALSTRILGQVPAGTHSRIVFHDGTKRLRVPVARDPISEVLRTEAPLLKYKIQTFDGHGWVDSTPYVRVQQLLRAGSLRKIRRLEDFKKMNNQEVARHISSSQADHFLVHSARRLTVGGHVSRQRPQLESLHAFFTAHRAALTTPEAQYVAGLVKYLLACAPHLDAAIANGEPSECLSALTKAPTPDSAAEDVAHQLLIAKLWSLADRETAAHHFAALLPSGRSLITKFYIDTGATTYYDAAQLESSSTPSHQFSNPALEVIAGHADAQEPLAIGMSLDPGFFRIYGPQILFQAHQMPELRFNLILCASPIEAQEVVADSETFRDGMVTMTGLKAVSNVTIWNTPVPDVPGDPKAFFASARFLAAPTLLERHKQVYLLDADLFFTQDPVPYMTKNRRTPVASSSASTGVTALSPWRRYTAGNVLLQQSPAAAPILTDIRNYLARGMQEPDNWMLDQNALAFAVERHQPSWSGLSTRPAMQAPIRSVWERNYRSDRSHRFT